MGVGFQVGATVAEVGTSDFLHAFFSTISYHLEFGTWGGRYPELMFDLYEGRLESRKADKVLKDILEIRELLKRFPPDEVVWNIEDVEAKPSWGNDISDDITDLSNYFQTSEGRDLFEVVIECLQTLKKEGGCMTIAK